MSVPLSIKQRSLIGSNACKKIRNIGEVPGILYGEKKDTVPVQFSVDAFVECRSKKDQIISLDMDGKTQDTIVQKVQYDSFGDHIIHVDFLRISKDKEITVPVALNIKGTPKGVQLGGTTNIRLKKVLVTCLPDDIPKEISVEISDLDVSEQLRVKEIVTTDKYKIANHADTTIVIVRPPRKAVETTEEEEVKAK